MSTHPGKAITIYDIAHLTAPAFDEAFNRKNIISGFLNTGCYPFNKNTFSSEDFVGAEVTEVSDVSQRDTTTDDCLNCITLSNSEMPSTSSSANVQPQVNNNCQPVLTTEKQSSKIVVIISDVKLTPEQIRPYPKAVRISSKKGRKKKISTILTATPEKNRLENEIREKEEKEKRAQERKASNIEKKKSKSHIRKVFDEETSESEIENYCEESDDSLMEVESEDGKDFGLDLTNIQKGDFVLIKFATKKTLKFFVGQIEKELEESEFLVNFLKMTPRQDFVFPDQKDESHISANDIMRKLPAPVKKIGTARSSSFFRFSVNFHGYNMG